MNLLIEIRNAFAEVKRDKAIPLRSSGEAFPAWVIRREDWYGVAIPLDPFVLVSERFSNVKLWSDQMALGDSEVPLLLLTSTVESLRTEFAAVCAQFLDPGEAGAERIKLTSDPTGWWMHWKKLLGNAVQEKTTYHILAEMLVCSYLLDKGIPVTWSALARATHDLETESSSYEVKSTIIRYDTTVTINSQFQLQDTGKPLDLIFCRFEPSETGVSVAELVERLVTQGMDLEKLNKGMHLLDLEEGRSSRNEKYKLLEMRRYAVDAAFPSITANSFVNARFPECIRQITYQVDLLGLPYDNWTVLP